MRPILTLVRFVTLLGCLVLITGGSAYGGTRARLLPGVLTQYSAGPTFAVRPPVIVFSGDGSAVTGGPHGTGKRWGDFGHITWLKWTSHEAIGLGVTWERCVDATGCPEAYTTDHRQFRFRLFAPADGHFTRVAGGMHVVKVTGPRVGSFYYMWFPDN
jgi:hypothetical protein